MLNSILKRMKFLICILIVFLTFIFGFFDLSISNAFYNPYQKFSIFIDNYGEIVFPIFIFGGSLLHIKLRINKNDKIFYLYTGTFLFSIIYSMFIFVSGFSFDLFSFVAVPIFLALFFCLYLFIYKTSANELKKYNEIAFKLTFAPIISLIIVVIVKILWGRMRFYDITNFETQFTPWYIIKGINGNFSFPSAHAAGFCVMIGLTYFGKFIKNYNLKRAILPVIILLIVFLSFSRIVIGAHFASDVLFGGFITLFSYFILDLFAEKTKKFIS